jgi:anti-sigma B factor antagonist
VKGGQTMTGPAPERDFAITVLDGLSVVTPPVEITIQNARQLAEALAAASGGHAVVVVDMTTNEFCDSSGISVLVMAQKRAREAMGEVRLVMSGSAVRRIFKVTGVDGIFRTFGSLASAVAAGPGLDPGAAGSPQP